MGPSGVHVTQPRDEAHDQGSRDKARDQSPRDKGRDQEPRDDCDATKAHVMKHVTKGHSHDVR